ncbi:hypothetical protein ACWYXN_03520 [Janthinobacterium aestuarii]
MKVFLSWSGLTSHKTAIIFRDWLPSVIQSIVPYVSSEDIDKGARWSTDIAQELEDSSFGILCVTKENVHAPWLTFEAGALSKTMEKASVSPFLFDIKRSEVSGPILQFQSTIFEKEDIRKLISSLNRACAAENLSEERLEKAFSVWYPTLEEQLNSLHKSNIESSFNEEKEEIIDTTGKILEEILDLTRSNQKLLRNPDGEFTKEVESIRMAVEKVAKRIDFDGEPRRMRKNRRFHPMLFEELLNNNHSFLDKFTGFQIAISLLKEDFPWLYDSGMETVKNLRMSTLSRDKRERAIEKFSQLVSFTFENSMMRDVYFPDKDVWMMGRELPYFLRTLIEKDIY